MKEFYTNLNVLHNAISNRKLVIFAGAGISSDSGAPKWGDLIKHFSNSISVPENETDFLRIAQMYFNERGNKDYIDLTREALSHNNLKFNPIHEVLFSLEPEHILTTNFDDLLEQVIKTKAHAYSIIKRDVDFPYSQSTRLFVKIHGDLEIGDLVFKEEDYLNYSSEHPLMETFLKSVFTTKVVLFVGYSFSDINLKMILQSVRNILGKDFQKAYILFSESNFHPTMRNYFNKLGLNVINYNDAIVDNNDYLFNYINNKKPSLMNDPEYKRLSLQGQKLYNFISYLSKYDPHEVTAEDNDIVTAFYDSISRFEEIKTLPQQFIANLYPIWLSNHHYENTIEKGVISTNNPKLIKFLKSEFIDTTNTIKDSFYTENNIPITEKSSIEKKLKRIISYLNYSNIHSINVGYFIQKTDVVKINENITCNCQTCIYQKFQLSVFLNNTANYTPTQGSDLREDLLHAYSKYKCGDFYSAFNQFEETANKAWQMGKYITYFICMRNIKTLRNLIKYNSDRYFGSGTIDNKKGQQLLEKINDIDLSKLLEQIPSLSKDEYKILQIIKENTVAREIEIEILHKLSDADRKYNLLQGGGVSVGHNYGRDAIYYMFNLYTYYINNCIIYDEYLEYTRVINYGLKVYFINQYLHVKHGSEHQYITADFFMIMVMYGDNHDLVGYIRTYKIDKLYIADGETSKIINLFNNYLTSFFEQSSIGHYTPSKTIQVSVHLFIKDNINQYLNNFLLLLSLIDIPEKNIPVIIKSFLTFLNVTTFIHHQSLEHLLRFIVSIRNKIDCDLLMLVLNYVIKDKSNYNYKENIIAIFNIIQRQFPTNKLDSYSDYLLDQKADNNKDNLEILISLYPISTDDLKQVITGIIEEELHAKFDITIFLKALYNDIVKLYQYKHYVTKSINNICEVMPSWNGSLKKWEHKSFFPKMPFNNDFYNLARYFYLSDKRFQKWRFTSTPQHWQFYLNPEEFKHKHFDPKWLLILNEPFVLNRLKHLKYIRSKIEAYLKTDYIDELAEIYFTYFK